MTRRRFYAPPEAFSTDTRIVTLSPLEARHLRDVLRLAKGAEAFVFDGVGREYHCIVEKCGRSLVQLVVLKAVEAARPESPLWLELAVALLKGEKFDLVVQKATELGAYRIAPVITKQGDVRLPNGRDMTRRVARWQRIALEAAKQSGRALVPQIAAPRPFSAMVEASAEQEGRWRLMFSEREGDTLSATIEKERGRLNAAIALVGPEGGWADDEIGLARDAGWDLVTLGGRTLRAETAAITVTALLQHTLGDLK